MTQRAVADLAYRWEPSVGRWRERATGRFVPPATVRNGLEGVIEATEVRMVGLTERLLAHTISLRDWQLGMAGLAKQLHLVSALAAGGDSLTPQQRGLLGSQVKRQYQFIDQMAQEIASGKQKLDGTLRTRTRQYAQAGRGTWEAIRGQGERELGRKEERNILHRADHCAECVALTARGWVPIGTLPAIGSRQCRGNDRCTKEYR